MAKKNTSKNTGENMGKNTKNTEKMATCAADVWKLLGELHKAQKLTEEAQKRAEEAQKRTDKLFQKLAADAAAEREKEAAERKKLEAKEAAERKKEAAERKKLEAKEAAERKKLEAEMVADRKRADAERQKLAAEVAKSKKSLDEALKKYAAEMAESKKRLDKILEKLSDNKHNNDEQIAELVKNAKELEKRIKKADGDFRRQWGRFLEDLSAGDFLDLVRRAGIKGVNKLSQNYVHEDNKGRHLAEFDFVGANSTEAVVGEVKTILTIEDVDNTIKKVEKHGPTALSQYEIIYISVIFLKAERGAAEYALKRGLIVIKSPGGKAKVSALVNPAGCKPKAFVKK